MATAVRLRRVAASRLEGWWNLRYLRNLLGLIESLAAGEKQVVVFRIGPRSLALVSEPAAAGAVLRAEPAGLAERGRFYREIERVVGRSSLVAASGEQHARLRSLLAPLFAGERIDAYVPAMAGCAVDMQAAWRDGETIDVGAEMSRLTLRIAGRALLALEIERDAAEILDLLEIGSKLFYRVLLPPRLSELLWRQRWLPGNRRLARAQGRLDEAVRRIVDERRMAGARGEDLLSALIRSPLGDEEIRDQVVTFLFAGHETTAQALTWAFHLLAENPGVETELHRELDRSPSLDANDLPYARAVVRETLRLYPPAWFLTRETTAATVVAGTSVPTRTMVFVSPWTLHRDGRRWPEPERFRPERWLGEERGSDAYLPFGRGRRNCIGGSFATVEAITVLATVARCWRLRPTEPGPAAPRATITLRPRRPIRMRLERRVG